MSLERMYESAHANEQATVEKIHRACATFMQSHPEYLPSSQNERIMFAAMTAPENDHLNPTRAADWEDVYAMSTALLGASRLFFTVRAPDSCTKMVD